MGSILYFIEIQIEVKYWEPLFHIVVEVWVILLNAFDKQPMFVHWKQLNICAFHCINILSQKEKKHCQQMMWRLRPWIPHNWLHSLSLRTRPFKSCQLHVCVQGLRGEWRRRDYNSGHLPLGVISHFPYLFLSPTSLPSLFLPGKHMCRIAKT